MHVAWVPPLHGLDEPDFKADAPEITEPVGPTPRRTARSGEALATSTTFCKVVLDVCDHSCVHSNGVLTESAGADKWQLMARMQPRSTTKEATADAPYWPICVGS